MFVRWVGLLPGFLKEKIKHAASQSDWDNDKKFQYVVDEFKKKYSGKNIKDHILNTAIELLYAEFKIDF